MDRKLNFNEKVRRNVLVVDDEMVNREILGGILEDHYNVFFAGDGVEALNIISRTPAGISLVLLDLLMPKMDGFEVLARMMEDPVFKQIPVIVLTSEKDSEVKSLKMGATDFIPKPYDIPEVILTRIQRHIELNEDRRLIKSVERDSLTGLYTGIFFYQYCEMMQKYRPECRMDAAVINIDRFHLINELYGRKTGDRILLALADLFRSYAAANEGIAGRGHGDTFYFFVNHQENYDLLTAEMEYILNHDFHDMNIKVRCGIYCREAFVEDVEVMFSRAKVACNSLRGRFHRSIAFFDRELQEKTLFRELLIHDCNAGLAQKQFIPMFQPKYDILGDKPVLKSAESLIRWKHPEYGMVSPGDFISLFENNGLIQKLDEYMWRATAAQIREWQDHTGIAIPVSVNASRVDFFDPNVVDRITEIAATYGISHSHLHIEVTESAYSDQADRIIDVVKELRSRGFLIELDDFGTGYSALNMISTMPFDILKLDKKFVCSMYDSENSMNIIKIIMDIARMLDVPVIAEGVETKQQYLDLKKMGCQMIQGYYFSKPVNKDDFEKLLVNQAREEAEI